MPSGIGRIADEILISRNLISPPIAALTRTLPLAFACSSAAVLLSNFGILGIVHGPNRAVELLCRVIEQLERAVFSDLDVGYARTLHLLR